MLTIVDSLHDALPTLVANLVAAPTAVIIMMMIITTNALPAHAMTATSWPP